MNGLLSQRLDQMLANLAKTDTNIKGLLTKRGGGLPKTGGGLRKTGGGGLARGRGLAGGVWQNRPKVLKDLEKDDDSKANAIAGGGANASAGGGAAVAETKTEPATAPAGNASASPSLVTVGGDTAALNTAQSPQPSAAQSSGAAQAAAKQQHTPATAKMLAGEQDAARPMFLIRPKGLDGTRFLPSIILFNS